MADKEYIERKEALLAITNDGCTVSNVEALMNVPVADVVEVVRCKDCKHFGKDMGYGKHDCKAYEMPYCLESDYCSYGVRKDENQ